MFFEAELERIYSYGNLPDTKSNIRGFGLGFYYSGRILIYNNYFLELRPGFIFAGSYSGLEMGLYLRKEIYDIMYLSAGMNIHYNVHQNQGNSNGYATVYGYFYNPGLMIGFNLSKKFIITSEIFKQTRSNYRNAHSFSTFESSKTHHNMKDWILKLGLEIKLN